MIRKNYLIDSSFWTGGELPPFTTEEVKNEPMLFNCCFSESYRLGGPITKCFLGRLREENPQDFRQVIVDTRVHMLMPGWYPAIPGYHHDDVARTRSDGQPDYDSPPYRPRHAMALINGDVAPTRFAVGADRFEEVLPEEGPIYKTWHEEVKKKISNGILREIDAPSNRLIYFNDRAWHEAVPAVKSGWRWFGRASFNTDRIPTNEVRRQVQVYLENPMEGW